MSLFNRRVLRKAAIATALSVLASMVLVVVLTTLLRGGPDHVSLLLSVVCPLLIAFPLSTHQYRQSERLSQARAAIEQMNRDLEQAHRSLADAHAALAERARRDGMTGVLNREGFFQSLQGADPDHPAGVLLIIDVDHFKSINDRFGHPAGDRALKLAGEAISSCTRGGDFVGRIGGEEFAVFLGGASAEEAAAVAERIREKVAAIRVDVDNGESIGMTVSIGGATGGPGQALAGLLKQADQRLYEAKRQGRNRTLVDEASSRVA
ncbi:GGDEF domain-containing protein [Phreatobacter sp. HK31-P]